MSTATMTRTRIFDEQEANQLLYGNAPEQQARWSNVDTSTFESIKENYADNQFIIEDVPLAQTTNSTLNQITLEPNAPTFESYIAPNTTPDISTTKTFSPFSFRPTIITEDSSSVLQLVDTLEPAPVKIAEVEMEVEHDNVITSTQKHTKITKSNTESIIKLNHKGMIVVGTFLAILLLVTVLVIINAVNLGSSASRLSNLRAESALVSSQRDTAQAERDRLYRERAEYLANQLNQNRNDNSSSINIGGNQVDVNYVGNQTQNVAQQPPWQPGENPDSSSNWFNNMSNWLSGLFR